MDERLANCDIIVRFNGDLFTWSDSEVLRERLEPHFRVENEIFLTTYPAGEVPPPDVIVQILASLLPLADIYINLVSSALYDALKAVVARKGRWYGKWYWRRYLKVTFEIQAIDENGRITHKVRGRTNDRDFIMELVRQINNDASRTSDND
jgi:hypothetical protein